jgi:hypothetical protein
MDRSISKLSPAAFAIVLICFLLPWVGFSCESDQTSTVTGLQLIGGTSIEIQRSAQQKSQFSLDRQVWSIVTLGLCVIGLGFGLLATRQGLLIKFALSIAVLVSHLLTALDLSAQTIVQSALGIQVRFLYGFWIALVVLIAATFLNGYSLFAHRRASSARQLDQQNTVVP